MASIDKIKSKKISTRKARVFYGIAKTTLVNYITARRGLKSKTFG